MKKSAIVLFFGILIGSSVVFTTGCKKDDTSGPAVTLSGDASVIVSLNVSFTDPGATANDDVDGSVTVSSDASSTNPDVNLTGVYVITYTATDNAGNVGSTTRTVTVKNDAESYAGNYNVNDTTGGGSYLFTQTITVDNAINNRVHFSRFNNYANNTGIYATRLPNGNLEIPNQTSGSIGAGGNPCDIANHTFSSSGGTNFWSFATGFVIAFSDFNTCNSASQVFTQIYTKN